MSSFKKIMAIALIATFLVSIPLTVLSAQADVANVVFTVEYDESYAKPDSPPGLSKPPKDNDDEVYKIWFNRYTVAYVPMNIAVYTENAPQGLTSGEVLTAVTAATDSWDEVTETDLILTILPGSKSASVGYNEENAVLFGDYPTVGVIAVASVWYSRRSRELLECDIMFDIDFDWGNVDSDGGSVMDLQNIATHEFGHCFNLADIYDSSQSHLTMYGYADYGETNKRSLEAGDTAGIQSLFGAPP